MKTSRATSAEDYKLRSGFQAVRNTLLEERFADRLKKPLAYWALPNDRRLPLAFLGRTLEDLLNTPFDELSSTPGIGQKKIGTLVKLLHRAAQEEAPAIPFGIQELGTEPPPAQTPDTTNGFFDPAVVSEALWAQWRECVRAQSLTSEKLGRLTPSLQSLPTVIWHTPLSAYLEYSLGQIRELKTHGEKRVRAVLEVFYEVYRALNRTTGSHHLVVKLVPKFVPPIEAWLHETLAGGELPTAQDLRLNLALPLLNQIEIDGGPTVHKLAAGRLGIESDPQSVRLQSRQMGVTRARVYQLLEDCSKIMDVRWPEGRLLFAELGDRLQREQAPAEVLSVFDNLRTLFYPAKHQLVEEMVMA